MVVNSGGARLYGPVFLNGLQKSPQSGPDRTVASLQRSQEKDKIIFKTVGEDVEEYDIYDITDNICAIEGG